MKLATVRVDGQLHGARLVGDELELFEAPDVRALLVERERRGDFGALLGSRVALEEADFAPLVPEPGKVICIGLNYRSHILEMGRPLPTHPTLFAKYSDSLIGAHDDIFLPPESELPDWEAELGVVIGRTVQRASESEARSAIAGFTVGNDVTMRDWQRRTLQWLQGKTFFHTTPVGPYLVTGDEVGDAADLEMSCVVNGETMQNIRTSELVFGPVDLVCYASTIFPLRPGDLILTGTPGGVGDARDPQRYLAAGDVVRTVIEGLGECSNRCVVANTSEAA